MDLGSVLLILALLVLVAIFVGRPILEKKSQASQMAQPENEAEHERSSLLAERDRLLNALQELDFDFALGKIPQEDYPVQRQALLQQGADVLRRLDAIQVEPNSAGEFVTAEARMEAAIAARRADAALVGQPVGVAVGNGNGRKHAATAVAAPDDQLEALLANRRRERREKAAGFCHKCGGPIQKSDRFCPKCGAKTA
jgi:hypothetical protein